MEMNILPLLSATYPNDSIQFINAVFNICRQSISVINQDVDNWKIFIHFYRLFVSWFVPLLIIFGEIGTLLCLIVLLRRRTGNAETRMWFVALSISDMYSMAAGLSMMYSSRIHYIFPGLMENRPSNHWDLRHSSAFHCYFLNGMVYFGLLVSTWIQVGISVLRVLSVKSKTPASNRKQRKKYTTALGCCILLCLLVTFLLIGFSIEYRYPQPCPLHKMCVLRSGVNQYFFYVSLMIKVLFPTIILLACSIMIINHLKKFKRQFSDNNNVNNNNNNLNSIIRKRVKQKHISYTLLGMNVTFFCLTLPFEVYKIYFFYNYPQTNDPHFGIIRVMDKFLNITLYANNATNWLFYFMLGKRFRDNMASLICQKYDINCVSLTSSLRRFSSSRRTNRKTKSTPVVATVNMNVIPKKPSNSPDLEDLSLIPCQPKFHCTYPAAQNTFPKFY